MKKSLIALAVLGSVSGLAVAQSGVTLYGTLDVGGRYADNGVDSEKTLASGGFSASKWGLKGVEVISDDLSASFVLESGFSVDTGSNADSSRFFNRRSTVSLVSKEMGELRLGRDSTPTSVNRAAFDPFDESGTTVGSLANLILPAPGTNQATISRFDNSIQYFLPSSLRGVYGQVAVSSADSLESATPNGNKHVGARLGYAAGPLNVAVGLGRTAVEEINGNSDVEEVNVGVSYRLGMATVSGLYEQRRFPAAVGDLADNGNTRTQQVASLAVTSPLGASGSVRALVARLSDDVDAPAGASQVALGYTYQMSKRTALYTNVAVIMNDDEAAYSAAGNSGVSAVAGKTYRAFDFGVRHTF
jgi:predicted porin